jgi:hypothetical protein
MEFKGTKGNWKRVKLEKTQFHTETNEIQYGKDGECIAEFVQNDYDAQLISCAPEMLDMLEEISQEMKNEGYPEILSKVNNLIKKATE